MKETMKEGGTRRDEQGGTKERRGSGLTEPQKKRKKGGMKIRPTWRTKFPSHCEHPRYL